MSFHAWVFYQTREALAALPSSPDSYHPLADPEGSEPLITLGFDDSRPRRLVLSGSKEGLNWLFTSAAAFPGVKNPNFAEPGSDLIVFSEAPLADIDQMFGRYLSYTTKQNDRSYRFKLLPLKGGVTLAYQNRFLGVRHEGHHLLHGPPPELFAIQNISEFANDPRIWPMVEQRELSDAQTRQLFTLAPGLGATIGIPGVRGLTELMILPPIRDDSVEANYLSSDRTALRSVILTCLDDTAPGSPAPRFLHVINPTEPLAVHAVAALDRPLLRDPLLDGGYGSIELSRERRTELSLHLRPGDDNPGQAYRTHFFTSKEWDIGPNRLHRIRDILIQDLRDIGISQVIDDGNDLALGRWDATWTATYHGRSESGICRRIETMAKFLPTAQQTTLDDLVLNQTSKTKSADRKLDDDESAESLFSCHAWRHPSGKWLEEDVDAQLRGWGLALGILLEELAAKRLKSTDEHLKEWAQYGTRLLPDRTLEVSGNLSEKEIWMYRFLLPFGWRVLQQRSIILDDEVYSILDYGYVLADGD